MTRRSRRTSSSRPATIVENRVNATGVAEPIVVTQGADRISVELPGVDDEGEIRKLIGTTGVLEFMPVPAGAAGHGRGRSAAGGHAGHRAALHGRRDRQRRHRPGPHDPRDRRGPAAQGHRLAALRRVRRGALRRAVRHRPRRRGHVGADHPGHALRRPGTDLRRPGRLPRRGGQFAGHRPQVRLAAARDPRGRLQQHLRDARSRLPQADDPGWRHRHRPRLRLHAHLLPRARAQWRASP